ncbi:hypothetical protein DERP_012958 [Dermatophagoides pteronyssinus]|uniref:Uncharacterized protein n=1 Tax=Dermatophagoides pteronyssinus TaxID=6956 RepID=A0ABQ8ISJ4_DERPT|nr:hypothetical protein DERP_012958 [Dermatophagoides pteronyssinus]
MNILDNNYSVSTPDFDDRNYPCKINNMNKTKQKKNVNKTVKQYGLLISIEHDCDDNDNNEKDT